MERLAGILNMLFYRWGARQLLGLVQHPLGDLGQFFGKYIFSKMKSFQNSAYLTHCPLALLWPKREWYRQPTLKKEGVMLKAKDVMSRTVTTIHAGKTLLEAIKLLVCNEISGMPVVDEKEKMIGIITEKDVLNFIFSGNLKNTRVEEIMTKKVVSFSPETNVDTIALSIGHNRFRRVPIVEGDKVVGIISRRDIIRTVLDIHCKI